MQLEAQVQMNIAKPVHEVFEAVADPRQITGFFITTGSGRLEQGRTIIWTWADHGAEFPIQVVRVEKDKHISFRWPASGVETLVEIDLEPVAESRTAVKISEKGWESDTAGIHRFGGNSKGWMHMVTCLKAFLEYGINLRTGAW